MLKLATLIGVPIVLLGSPILYARLSSYFCDKCDDSNWMSEGGGCGHGSAIWLTLIFMYPAAVIFLLILFLMPW